MHYIVLGNGRMGQLLFEEISKNKNDEVKIFDTSIEKIKQEDLTNVDMIIDFSNPQTISKNIKLLETTDVPILIATTGQSDADLELIKKISANKPVLKCPNTSFGINSTYQLVKQATIMFQAYDIEMIEIHHSHKIDSPSGTALYLLDAIKSERQIELINGNYQSGKKENQIAIHALRSGGVFGEHTIIFANQNEQIEITHRALSPELFIKGALNYAQILREKDNGLYNPINITKEKK
jgi:4-hydroxy-tetrahydrodipicolinate reductase